MGYLDRPGRHYDLDSVLVNSHVFTVRNVYFSQELQLTLILYTGSTHVREVTTSHSCFSHYF